MKNSLLICFFFCSFCSTSFGQTEEPTSPVQKDIVTSTSGKYIATEYLRVMLVDGTSVVVKTDAIAPSVGVINKENFVRLFYTFTMQAVYDLIPQGIAKVVYLTASEGTPDIEVSMMMSKKGLQTVVTSNTSNSGTKNTAILWSEIFK